jgi:predicted helicase
MSQVLITQYLAQLDLVFIPEYQLDSATRDTRFVDGARQRADVPDTKARAAGQTPKPVLKANPDAGTLTIDSETTLTGVPPEAWHYQLGSRCAIDWVLDQHKEKKPKDPTLRAKFDTYRLADHREALVALLGRVVRVSVETVRIVEAIRGAAR